MTVSPNSRWPPPTRRLPVGLCFAGSLPQNLALSWYGRRRGLARGRITTARSIAEGKNACNPFVVPRLMNNAASQPRQHGAITLRGRPFTVSRLRIHQPQHWPGLFNDPQRHGHRSWLRADSENPMLVFSAASKSVRKGLRVMDTRRLPPVFGQSNGKWCRAKGPESLVFEDYEPTRRARGAESCGEVSGFAMTIGCFRYCACPPKAGAARAIKRRCRNAR